MIEQNFVSINKYEKFMNLSISPSSSIDKSARAVFMNTEEREKRKSAIEQVVATVFKLNSGESDSQKIVSHYANKPDLYAKYLPILLPSLSTLFIEMKATSKDCVDLLKSSFGYLPLELLVELGYTALLVELYCNRDQTSKKINKDTEIANNLFTTISHQLLGKKWRTDAAPKQSLEKLRSLYAELGTKLHVDETILTSYTKHVDQLNKFEIFLFGCEDYSLPLVKGMSELNFNKREPALAFAMNLIEKILEIIPLVIREPKMNMQYVLSEYPEFSSKIFKNTKIQSSLPKQNGVYKIAKQVVVNMINDLMKGSKSIFMFFDKPLNNLKDSCQRITAANTPLKKLINTKDLLTQGRRLQRGIYNVSVSMQKTRDMTTYIKLVPRFFFIDLQNIKIDVCVNLSLLFTNLIRKFEQQSINTVDILISREKVYQHFSEFLTKYLEVIFLKLPEDEIQKQLAVYLQNLNSIIKSREFSENFLNITNESRAVFVNCVNKIRQANVRMTESLRGSKPPFDYDQTYIKECYQNISNQIKNTFDQLVKKIEKDRLSSLKDILLDFQNVFERFKEAYFKQMKREESLKLFSENYIDLEFTTSIKEHKTAELYRQAYGDKYSGLYKQLPSFISSFCVLKTPFSTLESIVYNPSGDWRSLLDFEKHDSLSDDFFENKSDEKVKVAKTGNKNISSRDNEKELVEGEDEPELAPKLESTLQNLTTTNLATKILSTKQLNAVYTSQIISSMEHVLSVENHLELLDKHSLRNRKEISRDKLALYDQRHVVRILEAGLEMVQSKHLIAQDKALIPSVQSLMKIIFLEMYLCFERGLSAKLLSQNEHVALSHDLRSLLSTLSKKTKLVVVEHLNRETILFRYPYPKTDQRNMVEILKKTPKMLQEFIELFLESQGNGRENLIEMLKEKISLEQTYDPKIKGTLTEEQMKSLSSVEQSLQNALESLQTHIGFTNNNEEKELLFHISKHVEMLSHLPTLLRLFPHSRYMLIQAKMLMLSSQYAVENIGLYMVKKTNVEGVVSYMAGDLHNLEIYCEDYELDAQLNDDGKALIKQLNVGKAFEYIHVYFARNRTISPCVEFISELSEWSFAASDAESIWLPRSRIKFSEEQNKREIARLQSKLLDYTTRLGAMIVKLVEQI